jgi:hypothetical protein
MTAKTEASPNQPTQAHKIATPVERMIGPRYEMLLATVGFRWSQSFVTDLLAPLQGLAEVETARPRDLVGQTRGFLV